MTTETPSPPEGWYGAPGEPGFERYWTGATWGDDRRPLPPQPVGAELPVEYVSPRIEVKRYDRPLGAATVLLLISFLWNPFLVPSLLSVIFSGVALRRATIARDAGKKVTAIGGATATLILGIGMTVLSTVLWVLALRELA